MMKFIPMPPLKQNSIQPTIRIGLPLCVNRTREIHMQICCNPIFTQKAQKTADGNRNHQYIVN